MSNAFSNAHIEGVQYGRIRRLSGFRKGHHIPEDHFDSASDFIRKIGQDEVKEIAERIHTGLRATFSYKRKQMEYVCHEGVAAIKTPDFEVNITITQDENDASNYAMRTEVTTIRTPDIVSDTGFCSLFNDTCDRLILGFEQAVDLEAKIDAIEENPNLESFLEYEPDCSSFTLKIPNPSIKFQITPHQLIVTLPGTRNLKQLIDHCSAAFETFSSSGVELLGD